MRSRGAVIVCFIVVTAVIAGLVWGPRYGARAPKSTPQKSTKISTGATLSSAPSVDARALPRSTLNRNSPLHLREKLRSSRDYAALVRDLAAAVIAGDPEAEYVSAGALQYCDENLKRFFRLPDGKPRTLPEAQSRWANRPAGYQAEIMDVYDRCHVFLDDPESAPRTSSWKSLLQRAADSGHPAAEAEEADLVRAEATLSGGVIKSDGDDKVLTLDQAKDLALSGAESGDPDALMRMSNWIDPKNRTPEEYGDLVSAWQISACQHGYDCDRESDWLRSLCNYDSQCADGDAYVDYFRRHLGSRFDEVQNLANEIGAAITSRNSEAIQSHL